VAHKKKQGIATVSITEHQSDDHGVVIQKNINSYRVRLNGQVLNCSLSPHMSSPSQKEHARADSGCRDKHHGPAKESIQTPADRLAVGDWVRLAPGSNGSGRIVEVLPRRNRLARRSAVPMPGAHPFEQVIAANVDLVVPVFAAANPAPHWNLLDRYLVSAESLELPSLVCIAKLDLAQAEGGSTEEELAAAVDVYRRIGYRVLLTSARTGAGLDELRQVLSGQVAVLVGKSGVGKTSLLNALQPGLGMRVNEVNPTTGKGRHTTSSAEMFMLDSGGALVDTPGVREFGLWDVDQDDLALFFPEMRPFIGRCRFGLDCQHEDEPGCALRKAVMCGEISPRRYQSFMRLKQDGYSYNG
jgi:ribosome biogenesis GTPase